VGLCSQLFEQLQAQAAILVTVHATRGSAPREPGAWMAVFPHELVGTVGGGHLEWQALSHARDLLLQGDRGEELVRYPLGPTLGQCCGGEVQLRFEPVTRTDIATLRVRLQPVQTPVALFGGGHVGHALVQVMGQLPMAVTWIDSRGGVFATDLPANVRCEYSDPVQAAVADIPSGSRVLVMSFSHAEDLEVVAACLQRQRVHGDLPYIGLIGSKSKWASFRTRLSARGFGDGELAHITCPIGITGIADKRPEVIAVAVAAQLLLLPLH